MFRFSSALNYRSQQNLMALIGGALVLGAFTVASSSEAHDAHGTQLESSVESAKSPLFAGCTDAEMVLGTDVNTVAFGGSRGYTPRCLKVKAGATVTIQASPRHPLEFVATSLVKATDPVAPSQVPVTRVFTEPGVFGFFCSVHGDASGAGMAGVIVVEPAHAPSALTNESLSPGENR